MRPRHLLAMAAAVALLLAGTWWMQGRRAVDPVATGRGPLVPALAARVAGVDGIELRGAGDTPLLALRKVDGVWEMPDRDHWPANQRQIGDALRLLAGAQRVEAKTAEPARWARLGVEDVATADAKGLMLVLSGGGEPLRLTIGNNHPALGGSYVRIGDDPQVWLADADLAPARESAVWLDRRLVDIPLARIERLRISGPGGRALAFARVGDRFGLDGQPPEALGDPDAGSATAGFTDQLALDDVARDSGAAATHVAEFTGVDGVVLTVQAWQDQRGTWARLAATLDEAKASAWLERAAAAAAHPAETADDADAATGDAVAADDGPAATGPISLEDTADALLARVDGENAAADAAAAAAPADAPLNPEARLAALRLQVEQWQRRFAGRQFLLPAYKAALLLKTREQYLAGAPR